MVLTFVGNYYYSMQNYRTIILPAATGSVSGDRHYLDSLSLSSEVILYCKRRKGIMDKSWLRSYFFETVVFGLVDMYMNVEVKKNKRREKSETSRKGLYTLVLLMPIS